MSRIVIEDGRATIESPEGVRVTLPLEELWNVVAPPAMDTCGLVLCEGVRYLAPLRNGFVVVHETPPRVAALKWIAKSSRRRYGPGTKYRTVRIALPYVVVVAVFERDPTGQPQLSGWNECFFRNAPLKSRHDPLCYPALLNCSRLPKSPTKPLVWICTQKLDRLRLRKIDSIEERVDRSMRELLQHLLDTGFNYSSEDHELSSYFTETSKAGVDPRVETVEAWEKATTEDPLFVLDVPWLPTRKSLEGVIERIIAAKGRARGATHALDLVRPVFQSGTAVPASA